MTTTHEEKKPWDFSNVLDLINTLSTGDLSTPRSQAPPSIRNVTSPVDKRRADSHDGPAPKLPLNALGDFSQIWQYLGSPLDSLAPKLPPPINTSPTLQQRLPGRIEYTSDGGIYPTSATRKPKVIQWRDETDGGGLTDVAPSKSDEEEDEGHYKSGEDDDEARLTKKQRYKRNKRERQKLEKAEASRRGASDLESEAETQDVRNGPARKASAHNLSRQDSPSTRYSLRERDENGLAITGLLAPVAGQQKKKVNGYGNTAQTDSVWDGPHTSKHLAQPSTPTAPRPPKLDDERDRRKSVAAAVSALTAAQIRQGQTPKSEWPVPDSKIAHASSFLPSTVQPSSKSMARPGAGFNTPQQHLEAVNQQTPSKAPRHVIQPKVIRSGVDRDWALLLKLISDFYEDRAALIRPANLSNHSNDPRGIHVFVDASNIFIGFHEQLKRARDIPQHVHLPQANMSFDALALLMERRRSVAKRALVGSLPHIAAFDVAKAIGYECSILDKVKKARELTDRQKYFAEVDRKYRDKKRHSYSNGNMSGGGSGSESTTAAPTHAPERFVEQGVDEIIHLKILESIVDVDEPTTIVLATGDAAQAEYSQGFMVMVERALKKGWNVELVSWSKNISQMYRKPAFMDKWGTKFKIVELDEYAEELLDM